MTAHSKSVTCLKSLLYLFGSIILTWIVLLMAEWAIAEIRFQVWLHEDEQRIDFSAYDDAEEFREVLLTKLPLGSSEEEVQTFRLANGMRYKTPYKSSDFFGLFMAGRRYDRGLFGLRPILFIHNNSWWIRFELDPTDHRLIDIHVSLGSGK